LYSDELQALSDRGNSITVTYAYTRATPENWPRPPGRIDSVLIAQATWPASLSPTCYVCGPTSFVESVVPLLTASGNDSKNIKTERFGPTGEQQ
jgi:ferredoxin-NADP reductase